MYVHTVSLYLVNPGLFFTKNHPQKHINLKFGEPEKPKTFIDFRSNLTHQHWAAAFET